MLHNFGLIPFFVNLDLGYAFAPNPYRPDYNWDADSNGGFTCEIGAGVKLSRKLSLGLFYQHMTDTREMEYRYFNKYWHTEYREVDLNWGLLGVKLEYQF